MTAPAILLDSCAAIWALEGGLRPEAERALNDLLVAGGEMLVSPITALEVGRLAALGRLALQMDPKAWFAHLLEGGVGLAPLNPDIFIESSFLPDFQNRDPMDRVIVATARNQNYRLMTRDRHILAYAAAGHVSAIAC